MPKIRMGMVGGGEGAFIGAVHRMAANLDGQIELVCGAFSATAEKSTRSGEALFLDPARCYSSYQEMMEKEAALPDGERMDFVSIVTPNHMHFPVAQAALNAGFHVMSDKPATLTLDEALTLRETVNKTGLLYGLTHTYTGYPLVREAKVRVANKDFGDIRKVVVEYPQGWLADSSGDDGKQAAWRIDPAKAGVSCCMGDIGVHAANLAEFVCGLKITKMCADLSTFVDGRQLDDDGSVLLKFNNGAKGVLLASQISVGEENGIRIRAYGQKGGLEWRQEEPNTLLLKWNHKPAEVLRTAAYGEFSALAQAAIRTPAGHPEGYLEAFANLYKDFAEHIRARKESRDTADTAKALTGIEDAVRGMAFIEHVVKASEQEEKWHELPEY